ncbi:MAG: flagellar biosynthesis protein FlhB [Bacillota bacterium]
MSQNSAGERTEKATSRKRRDARERGQVRKSSEVNTAFTLLLMFGVWQVFGSGFIGQMKGLLVQIFSSDVMGLEVTQANAGSILQGALWAFIFTMGPVLIAAVIVALLVNILQTGFLFSSKAMKPKFNRISPLQGFKRIFSSRSLMELGKSIVKTVVLGIIAYSEIERNLGVISGMMAGNVIDTAGQMISMIMGIAFKLGIALAIIAGFDYVYQWWKYEKDLRMTKQEVKDEHKRIEGDPQVKGRIRQKQRQIGLARMMQMLQEADVVITNPTHFAVALSYKEGKDIAPVVVAKGKDLVALRIREQAQACNIVVVENKPVARALFAACEVGDAIPPQMYQAVAEILAYLYRLKGSVAVGG